MAITTIYTYPLNGTQRDFTIPFEYLARRFVVVTLIGSNRRELTLTADFRFISKTLVQLNKAWGPSDGYERIEIRRNTSATDRLVDFADGSILRAAELNTSQVQTLHVAEEARNMVADTISENSDGDLDARGRRLVNLADALSPDHAVTLRQEQEWAQSTLGNRNAAETAAQLSVDAKNTAVTAKDTAVAQAAVSTTKASESMASAVRSEAAAATIGGNVALAKQARDGAESARDATVAAAQSVQGAGIPSASGKALQFLRQRGDESGLEYFDLLGLLSDPWSFQPIGVPIPVQTHLSGTLSPPQGKAYRYIKLTAGDPYNTGVISNEVVSGAGVLTTATATVSLTGSPINGASVRLINTEARVLRASTVSGEVLQDALQNITGTFAQGGIPSVSGAFKTGGSFGGVGQNAQINYIAAFDASLVARTSDETRAKSLGVTYFMRIK